MSFSVSSGEKCAIIGNNGIGKSTLLSIIAGKLSAATGSVTYDMSPYFIPQHFGQFNDKTVAETLGIADKLKALASILAGNSTIDDFTVINKDWDLQERLNEAFGRWGHKSYNTGYAYARSQWRREDQGFFSRNQSI
ncbi:MAG: ATP-binding cassette domain-containing protein [Duncaniella sp.]|nr:ATP-binding cassette domain-containing protein [Duncaniella sp.]